MNCKYFTSFELISDREKRFFSSISSGAKNIAEITAKAYRSIPRSIKGSIVGAVVASTFFLGYQKLTDNKTNDAKAEEKIFVQYMQENAPHANPTYHSAFVTPKRFIEMQGSGYYTFLKDKSR